jgi:hypothetical protein
MKKEEIEFELENLKKILQKMDTIISFNISGKFILSHEKIIGVRQMVLNSTLRLKDHLEKSDG